MVMQTALNPSLMSMLIEQAAKGAVKPASLISSVTPNNPIYVGNWRVMFKKNKPGDFVVSTYEGDANDPVTQERASTPVEAKLLAIDAAIERMKQEKGDNNQ